MGYNVGIYRVIVYNGLIVYNSLIINVIKMGLVKVSIKGYI